MPSLAMIVAARMSSDNVGRRVTFRDQVISAALTDPPA